MIKPRYLLLVFLLSALVAWAWPRPLSAPATDLGQTTAVVDDIKATIQDTPVVPESLTAMFGGDVMLGRDIAQKYQANSFAGLLSGLGESRFANATLSFVNFEAPISTDAAVPALAANNLRFIAPAVATKVLTDNSIKYAGLANNHTLTWGRSVLQQTIDLISQAGVTPVGLPDTVEATDLPDQTGQLPTTIIAINYVDGDMPGVTDAIKAASARGRTVIVVPHWGVEYQAQHNATQASLARSYVEAGADLVIGGHPHVTQDAEVVAGIPVIYSLGNLVFDQYFSTETQRGLLIGATITSEEIKLQIWPIKEAKGRPSLLTGEEQAAVWQDFCRYFATAKSSDSSTGTFVFNR